MTGVIATIPRIQFTTAAGAPLVGGKLYTYLAGTTTPAATFQDQALTTKNQNPVPLDANGSCALWLDPAKSYKFILKNKAGVTQPGWPVDNIAGASTIDTLTGVFTKFDDLTKSSGAGLVGSLAAIMGAVPRTVQKALQDVISLGTFGCVGDGVEVALNDAAWKKAEAYVNNFPASTFAPLGVFIPDGIYKYSYTPTFKRPVRIYSAGGAVLNYTGTDEVLVMGDKDQTSASAGTNDYYEIDNICFIGAANASYGIYFANWVLQSRVANCRFLNFGGKDMYAITYQGNNWSIDLLDNRYLVTDDAKFARHWCRVFGVSKTVTGGHIDAGQVEDGEYDGSNSRLNALNNWVRFGGSTPGIGYVVTGTKTRIVGGGVENPSVGVFFDGTGITIFGAEVSAYFESPYGFAVFQIAGRVSSLDIHDTYVNLHNDSAYNSTAKFFVANGDTANLTSANFRDLVVLNASKYPLVTLNDTPYQHSNNFDGRIQTNAPLLCAMANNYSMGKRGYQAAYHNNDLLGGLDTSLTQIVPAQTRVSSRLRVNAGAALNASVAANVAPNTGIPPCRSKHFALTWSSVLAGGNYIALEARMDDLGALAGGIATGGLVARYVNSAGAASIAAVLQLSTYVGGVSTVIAQTNITLTNNLQGFTLPQNVTTIETADTDFLALNLIIQGAGHAGTSAVEILNMDVSTGEFPPPVQGVDRPRQVATANQWYRRINNGLNQAGAVTSFPIQIGTGWASSTRNIRQISLNGATSAAIVPFGDSSVYVQPSPATGTFDIVFSVEAE